jgi:hypothetical protein
MTRLAKILVIALTASLLVVSSASALAPQPAHTSHDGSDVAAIALVVGLGLLLAGSALVPLGPRRRSHAQA